MKLISGKLKKNLFLLIVIAASGAIIYMLPYFRYDYYDVYVATYNLTDSQMGVFGSIFGIFGLFTYLFGGIVVDKLSAKRVLYISLILTGLGGFLHLLPLTYNVLLIIYAMWGVTSLFAFWPACIKAVRMLSDDDDSGKAFGIFEGGRGIAAAVVAPLALVAYTIGAKSAGEAGGMNAVILFHSITTTLCGVLVLLFMKDFSIASENKINFKDIGNVLKMPAVWIIGIVMFCTYVFTLSIFYFTPYSTDFFGLSVGFAAFIAASKRWAGPPSSIVGGFISDKIGTSTLLLLGFIVMALGTTIIMLLPQTNQSAIPYVITFFIVFIFFNVNYSITWAMMSEANIPVKSSGTAAGVISTVGYLPEVFYSLLAGFLISSNEGATGYRLYFSFVVLVLIIGAITTLFWKKYLKSVKVKVDSDENK